MTCCSSCNSNDARSMQLRPWCNGHCAQGVTFNPVRHMPRGYFSPPCRRLGRRLDEGGAGVSAIPLFRLVDTVYESLRKGSTTRTLSHMHSHAFFPTLYLPNYISYISLYYVLDFLLLHRRFLTDQLLAIQLRILFNSGTCIVSSPHLVSSD